jgi:hypothetical protein
MLRRSLAEIVDAPELYEISVVLINSHISETLPSLLYYVCSFFSNIVEVSGLLPVIKLPFILLQLRKGR